MVRVRCMRGRTFGAFNSSSRPFPWTPLSHHQSHDGMVTSRVLLSYLLLLRAWGNLNLLLGMALLMAVLNHTTTGTSLASQADSEAAAGVGAEARDRSSGGRGCQCLSTHRICQSAAATGINLGWNALLCGSAS
jgi:hypothetical protein